MGGVGGPVEATAFGPKLPRPKTGTPNFVGRIIQGGTQVAAVKLCELFARCARASIQLN
jgi:hypothetical protein